MRWFVQWVVWMAIFMTTGYFFPHEGWIGIAFFGAGVFACIVDDVIKDNWGS